MTHEHRIIHCHYLSTFSIKSYNMLTEIMTQSKLRFETNTNLSLYYTYKYYTE